MKVVKKRSKIIRRKPGSGSKTMYFHEGTTAAILAYQDAVNDPEQRYKLYLSEIHPAFDKLAENLIFIHGFKGLHDSYEDLKSDCVAFLYEAVLKFDRSRGTKPFSYFNVVAKRWLIIRSKQRVTKIKRNLSIDDDGLSQLDRDKIDNHQVVMSPDDQLEALEFIISIHRMLGKIRERVVNPNEMKCLDAIELLFKLVDSNVQGDDMLLSKRSVFSYLRDMSGLSPKILTSVVASLKRHYKELRNDETYGIY